MSRLTACALLVAAACAKPPTVAPPSASVTRADALWRTGCYECLIEADRLLEASGGLEERRSQIAVLLTLREKELGILRPKHNARHESLLQDITDALPVQAGYFRDTTMESIENLRTLWAIQETPAWAELRRDALTDPVRAYVYLSVLCSGAAEDIDTLTGEIDAIAEQHVETPLVQFKHATCVRLDREALGRLIAAEPRYHEAAYFLGKRDYQRRRYAEAETNLRRAFEAFPSAIGIALTLGDMYYDLEEMEDSFQHFENVVRDVPTHRDALLGSAKSLGYLGRHDEATERLHELIVLGSLYLGEAHYWLAWNEYQMNQMDLAKGDVQSSKRYQPMDSPTFFLSGIIAFNDDDLARAETELKRSVRLDHTNCEATSQLAEVFGRRHESVLAGRQYEQAAECYDERAKVLLDSIETLSLSPNRTRALIVKREEQLEVTRKDAAAAYYEAARAFLTAEDQASALRCAEKAALHPDYSVKADALRHALER